MQKGGVEPWEAIVVENAPLGVRAAVAAQCFTVAVNTGPLPDAELADEGANLILPSILQLSHSWNSLVEAVRNA
jgi:beta-phosphoglucomutase-like phosphatase (HAD superfamily)